MLQNLTKELEFFRREENKEELHEILNIYNSKRHPVIPYQVDNMIISDSQTWGNINMCSIRQNFNMFDKIQKGLGKKKKPVEPVHKDPNAQLIEEEKNGFDTIGGKEINKEYLSELRLNGSIGVGGKGQAVRLTDQDEIRGQRAAEEYVFNIVASNKVRFSNKFIRKVIELKIKRSCLFSKNHVYKSFTIDLCSS